MHIRVRSMCLVAMFAVLLALGAWVTVPGAIPFTMQTFVLYCVLWLLTPKQGLAAICLYLLLGAVGLPVFSGFQGGFGVLLGPTGGYLLGFLLMPLPMTVAGQHTGRRIGLAVLATLICYLFGTLWYAALYTGLTAAGIGTALLTCVLPFMLPDTFKLALSVILCKRLEPLLARL